MINEGDILRLLQERIDSNAVKPKKILFYTHAPVPYHVAKKNGRPIFKNRATGRSFTGKSPRLKSAEDSLLLHLRSEKNRLKIDEPFGSDLHILFLFGYKSYHLKKKAERKRLHDLSNLFELPQDCLQEAGIIADDNLICSLDLSRRIPADHDFIEIFIMELDPTL